MESRVDVIDLISNSSADVLVSNGLPFILTKKEFLKGLNINVHPSLLPDLRGPDPIRGAILHGRDSGATCHFMDEGVDTGPIISQVRIPYDPDYNATILYPLTFRAEAEAFRRALESGFSKSEEQSDSSSSLYASRIDQKIISPSFSDEDVIRTVMALRSDPIGAILKIGGERIELQNAWLSNNYFLQQQFRTHKIGSVVMASGFIIVLKRSSEHYLILESRSEVNSYLEGS